MLQYRFCFFNKICFADEIKSVFSPDEVGFHHEVISSHDSGIYSVEDGFSCTNKKKTCCCKSFFLLVREMGLEPIRDYHTPLKRARLPIPPLSQICIPYRNKWDYSTTKLKCQAFFIKKYKNFQNKKRLSPHNKGKGLFSFNFLLLIL